MEASVAVGTRIFKSKFTVLYGCEHRLRDLEDQITSPNTLKGKDASASSCNARDFNLYGEATLNLLQSAISSYLDSIEEIGLYELILPQ
jgi:hypothetical protein